jgi:ribonucleoside-diphosphate reductase alpha chain
MKHHNLPSSDHHFAAPIAKQIWDKKYRFQDPAIINADGIEVPGIIHDVTVEDTWRRIANALAEAEPKKTRAKHAENFYKALEDFKYLPAGRITAGSGTGRSVTLFNCFVMGTIPDDMGGIFDMLKEAALTMQQGGGIGYDFSTIRPKGELVKGVGSDASGPLSFMDVWDAMCATIMSAGSRRGAMMATMRDDHPDIQDFITAKRDSTRLRKFNLSVLISDALMEAVFEDADWNLVWNGEVRKTLRARELWDTIMQSTYDFAEPGVIFVDRINEKNPLKYLEKISATNPCGEQPLPPYGACLLGSINLARLISNPFEDNAAMDDAQMKTLVATAVRMMDNVVDVSNFALPQQEEEAKNKRRIGLGVTGVADALLMLKLTYGTEEAALQIEAWMRAIQNAAYRASVELAKEKGAFPLFDAEKYLESPTIQDLDDDIKADIAIYGIRNALLTSIAPTGTISLYAGNVSSGIEPVFAYAYTRKVLQKDGSKVEEEVIDYAVKLYHEKFNLSAEDPLPDYFVSAQTLKPLEHVRMQAAAQKWVDSSISKTINCPVDISFEDFKEVYVEAFLTGCKGCTTYRPNDITGSVLSVNEPKKDDAPATPAVEEGATEPMPREEELEGSTYKLKWPGLAHAFYITINDTIDEDGLRRPFEVFINTQNVEAQAWITALTRMISAVFRRGGNVSFVAKELGQICDPTGGAWIGGSYVNSLIAAIGNTIERHMIKTGFVAGVPAPSNVPTVAIPAAEDIAPKGPPCPECGEPLVMEAGCNTCKSCGYSKCSG